MGKKVWRSEKKGRENKGRWGRGKDEGKTGERGRKEERKKVLFHSLTSLCILGQKEIAEFQRGG